MKWIRMGSSWLGGKLIYIYDGIKKKKEEKGHNSKSKKAVMVIIMEMVTHGHDLFLSDGK